MSAAVGFGGVLAFSPPPTPGNVKSVFFGATNHDANLGDFRVQNLAATGSHRFTFHTPLDFTSLVKLVLLGVPTAGAAGAAKDIDLFSDYAGVGEAYNTHSQSDTTSTYNTGSANVIFELNIAPLFTSLAASDCAGIFVDHKSIGGTISYLGIVMWYS